METAKDYYAILGVLPTAEEVVVRAAYRALAQRYHPDRYEGDKQEANRKMAEINEAYAILSDADRRREYDEIRGPNTQSGNSYFDGEADDIPPNYDPLERDWAVAVRYYSDLREIESHLGKISWRLAYSFRAYLLQEKLFESRKRVADAMESKFLELYFGTNSNLVVFARELIEGGHKRAAKAPNQAARTRGSNIDAARVIKQIQRDFLSPHVGNEAELMSMYGITFDGERYHYKEYQYEKLADAVNYANQQRSRAKP